MDGSNNYTKNQKKQEGRGYWENPKGVICGECNEEIETFYAYRKHRNSKIYCFHCFYGDYRCKIQIEIPLTLKLLGQ